MSFINQLGRGIGEGAVNAAGNMAAHHSHDSKMVIKGLSFLIREVVHDSWGHSIELIVVNSPDGKLNSYSTGTHNGKNSNRARQECITCLEYQVEQTYK